MHMLPYKLSLIPHATQLLTPPLRRFDSSVGRGDFVTAIGVGKVIKGNATPPYSTRRGFLTADTGWDEGVTTMQLGEKATLDITR